jgi:hypothetical protein
MVAGRPYSLTGPVVAGRMANRDSPGWTIGTWTGCLHCSTLKSSTLHLSSPMTHNVNGGQRQGGRVREGGGERNAYQVTVAGQAPLSIHCEREEGEDGVERDRGRAKRSRG